MTTDATANVLVDQRRLTIAVTMLDTAMRELDEAEMLPATDERRLGLLADARLHGEIALEELRAPGR